MRWPAAIGLSESQQFLFGLWLRGRFQPQPDRMELPYCGTVPQGVADCNFSCTQSSPAHQTTPGHLRPNQIVRRKRGSLRDPILWQARAATLQPAHLDRTVRQETHSHLRARFRVRRRRARQRRQTASHGFEGDVGQAFIQTRQAQYVGGIHPQGISSCGRASTHLRQ